MACALALQCAAGAGDTSYKLLKEIPIGGEGGWDILTVDSPAHRLYLSHSSKVVVVDLAKNVIAGEITDTPGVHGFVAIPELGRGFSSNGKEAKASVVDLTTLKTISKSTLAKARTRWLTMGNAENFTCSITKGTRPP
ncbi:MAG: hypothetical protein ACR2MW_12195 [Chthoniobacterales bacterium]